MAGAKYGNRDGGGRCRRDTRSRLLKLSGFLGEQRQLRRLGETGPYKDNEVRGTYDSTRLVSSAAFQQGPVTFYVRTYAASPDSPQQRFTRKLGDVSDPWPSRSFALLVPASPLHPSVSLVHLCFPHTRPYPTDFPRILAVPRRRIGNFQYSNDLGRKVGYLGTRAPLKRVLRPASDHHLPCSLLPFSFDSSLAAAPPSISQFLASENFSFLAPFPRRTIFKFKNALSILSRNLFLSLLRPIFPFQRS